MSRRLSAFLLTVLLGATLVPLIPGTQAGHWCSDLMVTTTSQGYQGDVIPFLIGFENGIDEALDLRDIVADFEWGATVEFGNASMAAHGSDSVEEYVEVPGTPGEYAVDLRLSGKSTGDVVFEDCFFSGTFRALVIPPPPSVIVTANPSTGSVPLTVTFTATVGDGVEPFTYAWSFGDGEAATGSTVTHTYRAPGTYTVQLVVTDDRGRSDSATVSVEVAAAFLGVGGHFLTIAIVGGVVAVLGAAVYALRKRR